MLSISECRVQKIGTEQTGHVFRRRARRATGTPGSSAAARYRLPSAAYPQEIAAEARTFASKHDPEHPLKPQPDEALRGVLRAAEPFNGNLDL